MAELVERLASLEADQENIKETMKRHAGHIGELLTFKNNLEGGLRSMKWILGLVGITNLVMIAKMFLR